MNIKSILHGLPPPVQRRLRFVRDQIAIRTFRPRIVVHNYGGIQLRVKIGDKMSATWYDRDFEELPEITFLKGHKLRPGARVFDLGCHHAVIALLLARIVENSGSVTAVEAGRYNFQVASENKQLNEARNLAVLRAAVAEKAGIPINFSGGINGSISSVGETILATSVDSLAAEFGQPDVVMLDVEGYELKALEGATATLRAGPDWYLEVHTNCGLEDFGGTSKQVVDVFRNHGYNLYVQTDEHYRDAFRPMESIPSGRFFLIAVK